jgi:hypothetical protein
MNPLSWIASLFAKELVNKAFNEVISLVNYLISKVKRDNSLKDNAKKLDEALKSGDDEKIKDASGDSLNGG